MSILKSIFSLLKKDNFLCFFLVLSVYFAAINQVISILLTLVLLGIMIVNNRKIRLTSAFYFLVLFSLFFSISCYLQNIRPILTCIRYLVFPPMFFILGLKLTKGKMNYTSLVLLFALLSIALLLPLIRVVIPNIINYGLINISRTFSFNDSDSSRLSATLVGLNVSISLLGIGLLFGKAENLLQKRIRILYFALSLLGLLCIIHLVTRTGIFIILACIFFSTLLYFWFTKKGGIKIVIIISFIIVIIASFFYTKIQNSEAFTAYQSRDQDDNLMSAGSRTYRWKDALEKIPQYPFGWYKTTGKYGNYDTYYAHNLWLDIARMSGILPFLFFLIFTISTHKKIFKIIFSKNISSFIRFFVLNLSLIFFLSSFVEPVIEGSFQYLLLYILFLGCIENIYTSAFLKK